MNDLLIALQFVNRPYRNSIQQLLHPFSTREKFLYEMYVKYENIPDVKNGSDTQI